MSNSWFQGARVRGVLLAGVAVAVVALASATGTVFAQAWAPVRARMVVVGQSMELPIDAEKLDIEIDGQHATTKLSQVFVNNQGGNVEGQYTLVAGPGARANGFAYWNGEEKIVGEVFEKEAARRIYNRVTRARRDPGLLEEKADGVFSFVVSPIAPNERKRVEVTYSRWLPRKAGTIEFVTPVSRPDAEIAVLVRDGRELRGFASSTHEIEVKPLSGKYLVRGKRARGRSEVFALRYEIVERPFAVSAYVHKDKGQDAFFAVTMAAPAKARSEIMPKDVTLVIDRSGSMSGGKFTQAREACLNILKRLGSDDRVNVILFDHDFEKLFKSPQPVTNDTRKQALEFVELMQLGGGTNLDLALTEALDAQREGKRPRVILFFTDGQSDPGKVLDVAEKDKRDARVFTIGLGQDVNRALLSRLAAMKRGRFTFIPSAADIERQVGALYQQIEEPVLLDLSLRAKGGTVFGAYPRSLPDLFNSDEILATGRLRGKGTVELTVTAMEKDKPVEYKTEVVLGDPVNRPWVGRLWAKSRIDDLLDEIKLKNGGKELVDEVTELGLAYNFVTPYTSFLAIPAAEVDAVSAGDLESARAWKQKIKSNRAGAAELGSEETAQGPRSRQVAQPIAAPSPSSVEPDSENDTLMREVQEESSSAPTGVKDLKSEVDRGSPKKGGCASCALGARSPAGPTGLILVLGLVATLGALRRRR